METIESTPGLHETQHPRDQAAVLAESKTPAEEDSDTDEGLGGLVKSQEARSKTRRARRKAYKPYYQLSEGERGAREERERLRVAKLKERMWAKGRIIAPYNTTQFLMSDGGAAQSQDFYYSSPADNDHRDFMSNEFKKDYEVHNLNRLEKLSKEMLLNEYLMLERKNERLEEKLRSIKAREEVEAKKITDSEYAKRANKLQLELEKLKAENERLAAENLRMKARLSGESSNESESEESSSDDDETSSSSSQADLESLIEDNPGKGPQELPSSSDDPGYESNQSKSDVK